jgi:hypothetical protein
MTIDSARSIVGGRLRSRPPMSASLFNVSLAAPSRSRARVNGYTAKAGLITAFGGAAAISYIASLAMTHIDATSAPTKVVRLW